MVRRNLGLAGVCAILAALALSACGQPKPAGDTGAKTNPDIGAPAPQIQAEDLGPPATPDVQAKYEGDFEAVGDEPFWRLDVLDDYVAFTRPGLSDVGGLPQPREYRANGARIVAGPLTIVLKAETCQYEGGETLDYKAVVQFEGVSYEGCARRGADQASKDSDWTSEIDSLLPAIDACIGKADKKPARVTIAYAMDDGTAVVRILDGEGGRYECNAPAAGGAVTAWDPVADQSNLSGERDPLFTRTPTAAPTGKCYTTTPAKLPNGKQIGWYSRRTC
jgi:uncharacterized membrane protein